MKLGQVFKLPNDKQGEIIGIDNNCVEIKEYPETIVKDLITKQDVAYTFTIPIKQCIRLIKSNRKSKSRPAPKLVKEKLSKEVLQLLKNREIPVFQQKDKFFYKDEFFGFEGTFTVNKIHSETNSRTGHKRTYLGFWVKGREFNGKNTKMFQWVDSDLVTKVNRKK